MPQETFLEKKEESLSIQIFSVSATLTGVCLTVIGILGIFNAVTKIGHLADELLAVDVALFLFSCIISYMAIRTQDRKRRLLLEKIADVIFLVALSLIVIASIVISLAFL